MQTATFERNVGWMPSMSVVRLDAQCVYTIESGGDALNRLNKEINTFARNAKEHCLREIANDSINRIMIVNSERHPQRMGTFGEHTRMTANVNALEDAADILHIDELEKEIRDAFWKHIATSSQDAFHDAVIE
jgi:hypothetical protein